MAESYGFFDAEELIDGSFDREYLAEHWANYFKLFISNGVFATPMNQLKVIAYSGMYVKILPGWAFINGYWYHNDTELVIEIPVNSTTATITDGVFITWDSGNRTISATIGVGRTTVDRVAPHYELKLAEITIGVGVTALTDANITDTRANTSVCGFVTGLIDVINTTDLFAQYQAIFDEFISGSTTDFDTWFEAMKDQLSSDAAGHLQDEVDALNAGKEDKPTILTGILTAGETSISFTDSHITNTCYIDIYTDVDGANPRTKAQSGTTVTLTFKAQAVDVTVTLMIREV